MGRVQTRLSPTHRHAKRIAAAIAKGKPPLHNAELDEYLESSPHELSTVLAGAARNLPPAGEDEALAMGYVLLLQGLLEHLRWRSDCGYEDAARQIAEFQAEVAAQAEAGRIDARLLSCVGRALHEAKIACAPELAEASARLPLPDIGSEELPPDVDAALSAALDACDGNPFAFVGTFLGAGHAMPREARAGLTSQLALSDRPDARACAVLFLLDPDRAVRRAVGEALEQVAGTLSPEDLRRLIAMRNWRPQEERAGIDAIIRRAREAGIVCGQWPDGSIETLWATVVDATEAQGFVMICPAGRKRRVASILTKRGITDAFCGEPESRRKAESVVEMMDAPALAVSRSYLDRMMAHQLALTIENGTVPPVGLLQVAETIGGADWQPVPLEFKQTLAELMRETPSTMLEASEMRTVLRRSGELPDIELIALLWFEDEPRIAEVVGRARHAKRGQLADYLLQTCMSSCRGKWADVLLRTALWMRAGVLASELSWRDLAIVAKALAEGHDMTDIGIMRDIALRTIEVHSMRAWPAV